MRARSPTPSSRRRIAERRARWRTWRRSASPSIRVPHACRGAVFIAERGPKPARNHRLPSSSCASPTTTGPRATRRLPRDGISTGGPGGSRSTSWRHRTAPSWCRRRGRHRARAAERPHLPAACQVSSEERPRTGDIERSRQRRDTRPANRPGYQIIFLASSAADSLWGYSASGGGRFPIGSTRSIGWMDSQRASACSERDVLATSEVGMFFPTLVYSMRRKSVKYCGYPPAAVLRAPPRARARAPRR